MTIKTKLKSNQIKDNTMTDQVQEQVTEKKSRKGGTRKPQEFLMLLSMKNKSTGEALNLNDYEVTATPASNKDFKTVLAATRNDPNVLLLDVSAPAPTKKIEATA